MGFQQEFNGEIDAVVDRDRDVHLRAFLDQLLHGPHAELWRNRDDQTIPRGKDRQRAERIFSPERSFTVMSHRWDNRRIEPDQVELSCSHELRAVHSAAPGGAHADRERIRRTRMRCAARQLDHQTNGTGQHSGDVFVEPDEVFVAIRARIKLALIGFTLLSS